MRGPGGRVHAGYSDISHLVGTRGALDDPPAHHRLADSRAGLDDAASVAKKRANAKARQARKKLRRRERWEAQLVAQGRELLSSADGGGAGGSDETRAGKTAAVSARQARKDEKRERNQGTSSTKKLRKIYQEQGLPGEHHDDDDDHHHGSGGGDDDDESEGEEVGENARRGVHGGRSKAEKRKAIKKAKKAKARQAAGELNAALPPAGVAGRAKKRVRPPSRPRHRSTAGLRGPSMPLVRRRDEVA
eukprot:CAMPEP_0119400722 /NCGR_PEP_ID=MMETSP1334-20130426/142011_1 /TAXON_ID=127549 /ORGANISM="Calcidiscus leptoporus, Strain RCC1130" /LENGTH=246 /DNA_ID=CAMNT_0007424631 /DNA_START=53 /DNA_END=793 /DNA_ORIENTATION=-